MPPARTAALRALAAIGLGYQSYAHAHLASTYDAVRTATVSQGDLFRVEAVAAALAAVGVLAVTRWWAVLAGVAVGGGGLAAVVLYRYVQVGPLGPLPDMTEMTWYPEKSWAAVAAAVATVASAALLGLDRRRRGIRRRPSGPKVTRG